jgi:tight adherence protein B
VGVSVNLSIPTLLAGGLGSLALFFALWRVFLPDEEPAEGAEAMVLDDQAIEEMAEKLTAAQSFRTQLQSRVGSRIDKSQRGTKVADSLMQADLKLRASEWILLSGGVAVMAGALLSMRFGSPLSFPIGAVAGWFGMGIYLRRRVSRRRRTFEKQLGPAVLAISNGVKAGYTFAQAIDLVSKNAAFPMGIELTRVTRETQLGVPLSEALGRMVTRNESEEMRLMLTAVQIQQQVGGNLATILDSIEFTIRERVRIKGEVRTLTGQARASGWILIILPFALAGILTLIAPSYFTPMFKKTIGQVMLGAAGVSLALGYAIIQKIVDVEV